MAEQFDADQVAADARSVAERVSEGRFYVACIGQFTRPIAVARDFERMVAVLAGQG